jgi:hypothetical protein
MLHMTSTTADGSSFGVVCRCGWFAHDYGSRRAARNAGDDHLLAANAFPVERGKPSLRLVT